MVWLNVAQSQGKVGGNLMAVATLITLVHLTPWVRCSQPTCGDVQAAVENDIFKTYNTTELGSRTFLLVGTALC